MSRHRPPLKVGYVLKRFPRLSQTFVLNEILELERQGVDVEVFSLLDPPLEPRHDLVGQLAAPVTYLSDLRQAAHLPLRAVTGGSERRTMLADRLGSAHDALAGIFAGKTPQARAGLTAQAAGLALLAAETGCTHLHAHFATDAATVAMLAGRISAIPYSFTAHARDIYRTYVDEAVDARMRRQKIAAARFVVTVSDFNCRYLRDLVGQRAAGKVLRLYNGVDLGRLAFCGSEDRTRGLVLAVGRLVEKKGFGDLLDALALLDPADTGWRCIVVGDGPLDGALRAKAEALGIGDRISFLGARPQDEVIALMRKASVMALPCVVDGDGDRDGLPTVLLEAQALGLPVISTGIAGIPEIIRDGKTGLLVAPRRPDLLAAALGRVLLETGLARMMARQGRAKAERDFDLKANVDTLRALFQQSSGIGRGEAPEPPRSLLH